ncbi:MAG: hypothetical protein ACI8ZB_000869 [Desulforhopalus sp.]|jgi:hypothetical protein
MQLSFTQISLILPCVACLLTLTKYALVKKENKLLSDQLTETTIRLENNRKELNDLQDRHNEIKTFHKSIEQAELTTKFQAPRLHASHGEFASNNSPQVPEKYLYIRSLTEKGMSPEEIGAVLSISPHEARQLVALTKITGPV